MWTLARILIGIVFFFVKLRDRRKTGVSLPDGKGGTYLLDLKKKGQEKKKTEEMHLGAPFVSGAVFWLHREGTFDRLLKGLGLAEEIQTGDESFDHNVYIVSDNPAVASCLRENAKLRRVIVATIDQGFDLIHADGRALWIRSKTVLKPRNGDFDKLFTMVGAFKDLKPQKDSTGVLLRVAVVEIVVAVTAGYAASVALDFFDEDPTLVFPELAIFDGIALSVGLFVLLFGFAILLLRRSSRARWVLAESLLVLLLSVLAAGFGAVRDLNATFDRSDAIDVERPVTDRRIFRGRKGRKRYYLGFPSASYQGEGLPTELKVSRRVYDDMENGGKVTFRIKEGSLGYPWYQRIETSR